MYNNIIKRMIDFLISTAVLIMILPVFLIIGVLIKIDSPGPVFFTQKRVGLHGKHFKIYKFRTMKIDTPDLATDKLSDPGKFVTKIGKYLRKTSLDEIPQLINIIKGDMSIVGPRPALYNQYELIEEREKYGIHAVRPGLTGYAQVLGRDFISDQQKVEYDKFYIDHMSFYLDIKIILLTIVNVVKADGVKF